MILLLNLIGEDVIKDDVRSLLEDLPRQTRLLILMTAYSAWASTSSERILLLAGSSPIQMARYSTLLKGVAMSIGGRVIGER